MEEERSKEPHLLAAAEVGPFEFNNEDLAMKYFVDHEFVARLAENISQGPGGADGTEFVLQGGYGALLLLRRPAFKILPPVADTLILDVPAHLLSVGIIGEHREASEERTAAEVKIGMHGRLEEHRGLWPPELLVDAAKGSRDRFRHVESLIGRRGFEWVPGGGAPAIFRATRREEDDIIDPISRDVLQECPG